MEASSEEEMTKFSGSVRVKEELLILPSWPDI